MPQPLRPGAFAGDERGGPYFAFDERWLRTLTQSASSRLSIIRVEGDSMAPTLNAGDDILVDLGDSMERLRDGIYVLRADDVLVVKRLAIHPTGREAPAEPTRAPAATPDPRRGTTGRRRRRPTRPAPFPDRWPPTGPGRAPA